MEPFGGAGSVLLRKERSYGEVWNDLDGEVVNLFRVLRSDDAGRLVENIRLTPFARDEFERGYDLTDDPVERARRLVVRSFMGFGAAGANFQSTGFRANSNKSGTTPSHDWANYPDALRAIVARMAGVTVESRDAGEIIHHHDSAETLHYVDPPYVHDTRCDSGKHRYAHELTIEDHRALLDVLRGLTGMVVLSGYPHPLYDDTLADWRRVEREARADGARPRTEVLWLNPACAEALDRRDAGLFDRHSHAAAPSDLGPEQGRQKTAGAA